MIELYNALKYITILFFIQKILTFNLGVAFLKSVNIVNLRSSFCMKYVRACVGNSLLYLICITSELGIY